MSTVANNQWVAETRERIFANSAVYNAETPMAGRTEALAMFKTTFDQRGQPKCLIIAELLGAGKTFFLQKAFGELNSERIINEQTDVSTLIVDDFGTSSPLNGIRGGVLVVEELDRKAEWGGA